MDAKEFLQEQVKHLCPPPPLTCSEWADTYRYVASGPFPGKWSTARTPDLKEPMDCITDPLVEMIVIIKPIRHGASEGIIGNGIGYFMHYDPCKIMYVQTSIDEGIKYSNEILMPMIENTPVLKKRLLGGVGRKGRQTRLYKAFPGGNLTIVGAHSPKGFRMVSKRVVIMDDIDGYDENPEGDVIKLAAGRAKDYWNKKIIMVSNPSTEGVSKIAAAFEQSDMRYRHVPCPLCGEFQILKFGGKDCEFGIKWENAGEDIWYECEHCHGKIYEYQKNDMNVKGYWKAEAPFHGIAGFHLNPFVRAWHPWKDMVREFLASKGDPKKLMVFVNQTLGEVWKSDQQSKIDDAELYARREIYPADVPAGALILTAAADVQKDRVEVEIKGWGPGEESWGIEYRIIPGAFLEEKTQQALDDYLSRSFRHESGVLMNIQRTFIDSGGHYTSQVYEFCKRRESRGIYAIKGSNQARADVLDGKLTHRGDATYQMVGVTSCKDILLGRMALKEKGAGYMHWPMSYDREYFKQLFGERPVVTKSGKREWREVPGVRNEAIDLNNYNLAALRMYAPDWEELRRQGIAGTDNTRLVYKHHRREFNQDESIVIRPELPIVICCDFAKNPLTWPLCQSYSGKVWVFDEVSIRNATTMDMAIEILKKYGNHHGGFVVYGSAAGIIRASTGKSEYAILKDMGFHRQAVKQTNPLMIDRINAVNYMLEDIAGAVRLKYHPNCIQLRKDFEQAMWKEDMSDIAQADFGRGNASEALGFFINYEFPLRSARPDAQKRFYK